MLCTLFREWNKGTRHTRKTYGVRVNGLPHDIIEEQLRAYFDEYGTIESVFLIKRQSYGYVNFNSLACAQEAAKNMNGSLIGGKVVECKASTEPRYTKCKPANGTKATPPAAKHIDKISTKPPPVAKYTVKVSCIAKATTERTLFNLFSLDGGEDPESVRIVHSHMNPLNHAFVNFYSQRDAKRVVETLNYMYVDGSQIRVRLHTSKPTTSQPNVSSQAESVLPSETALPQSNKSGSHSKYHSTSGSHPVPSASTESCTVKVTFFGTLTPKDIRDVFSPFGTIRKKVIINDCAQLPSTFITFSTPKAAKDACSLHNTTVKQVKIYVVIQGGQKLRTGGPLESSEISCSSLVASILHTKCKAELEGLEGRHQVKVSLNLFPPSIRISGKREKVAAAEKQLQDLKEQMEVDIRGKDFDLPFHCVPLFEKETAITELRKIETSHAVEFNIWKGTPGSNTISLEAFSGEVKQCFIRAKSRGSDSIPAVTDLASYFSQGATGSRASSRSTQWFYKDDDGIFVEYTAEQSTKLAQMFEAKIHCPMVIKGNTYVFDFNSMTQRNTHSGRSRAIQRHAPIPDIKRMLTLRVTGLHSSLDPSIRELQEAVKVASVQNECRLYDDSSEIFKKKLMANVNKYFVSASLADGRLVLKGIPGYVEMVRLIAEQEKISEREAQVHAAIGGTEFEVPPNWRTQSQEVILDVVRQNSTEWQREVDILQKTLKGVTVWRLERIQNKWLWERYSFAKRRMLKTNKGHVNEKHLFHGTRGTEPEKVFRSEKGVDFRFSREGLWGTGSYFAVNASYSDAYAYSTPGGFNVKQMFICKVLTGDCYNAGSTTDKSLRQPPLKSSEGHEEKRYDSVKGHTNGSDVYVVYDHEKVYPAYLVTYSLDSLAYVPSSYSYQPQQTPPTVPPRPKLRSPKQAKKDSCVIS